MTLFMELWTLREMVQKDALRVERVAIEIFEDFSGIFRNYDTLDQIGLCMAKCFTNRDEDVVEIMDWLDWYNYDKPDGPSTIVVDSLPYIIETREDLEHFFISHYSNKN